MDAWLERFIAKGEREPYLGLVQQGEHHVGLIDQYKAALVGSGLPPAKADSARALLEDVKHYGRAQRQGRDDGQAKTRAVTNATAAAKAFIFKLGKAVPMVLLDEGITDVTVDSFRVGLLDSTPRVVRYLENVRHHVERLAAPLAPYFRGESPLALLDKVKADLEDADRAQELARAQLPDATLKLYEAKGKLLQLIEDVNRVAAIAFYGQADVVAKFNKDLLLRARRAKKDAPENAEATTEG